MTREPGRFETPAAFDFARLIAPVDERTFFDEYWEKRPLVLSRARENYYAGLCSMRDIDHILTAGDLRYPALRLIKNGPDLPLEAFTHDVRSRRFVFTGVCDVERVLEQYQQGATILLQRLDRSWPALGALCRSLEERFFHAADANVYLTPKAAQGFGAHYDTHDVFVLQIAGTKHWRLYDAPLRLPLESQPFNGRVSTPGPCLQELDVHPGDLVYVPRGTIHEALTSETSSLHVTIGITPQTWTDVLVNAAMAQAAKDDRLREAVPLSSIGGAENRADLQEHFARLLASVASDVDVASVLAAMQARFVAERRPRLEGRLEEIEAPAQRSGGVMEVSRRPGLIYRIAIADGNAILSFHSKTITYPAQFENALRHVAAAGVVDVGTIPGLDVLERTLFVQRLIKEGFLVVHS